MPPPQRKFPWDSLPSDLRHQILSQIPLDDLLSPLQTAFPNDAPALLHARIKALHPLHRAWLDSPIAVRNIPTFRTRAARAACTPAQFVRLPRLVLGASRLRGKLTHAVAELGQNLKVLHLDDNQLDDLPQSLDQCRNLLVLDCSANNFCNIPDVVARLTRLKYLVFSHNPRLDLIPIQLALLPHLQAMSFYMCALTEIPIPVVLKVLTAPDFTLNVAANNFPRLYLVDLCYRFPAFKRKLTHVMVE